MLSTVGVTMAWKLRIDLLLLSVVAGMFVMTEGIDSGLTGRSTVRVQDSFTLTYALNSETMFQLQKLNEIGKWMDVMKVTEPERCIVTDTALYSCGASDHTSGYWVYNFSVRKASFVDGTWYRIIHDEVNSMPNISVMVIDTPKIIVEGDLMFRGRISKLYCFTRLGSPADNIEQPALVMTISGIQQTGVVTRPATDTILLSLTTVLYTEKIQAVCMAGSRDDTGHFEQIVNTTEHKHVHKYSSTFSAETFLMVAVSISLVLILIVFIIQVVKLVIQIRNGQLHL